MRELHLLDMPPPPAASAHVAWRGAVHESAPPAAAPVPMRS
jgi:hypothetical protein